MLNGCNNLSLGQGCLRGKLDSGNFLHPGGSNPTEGLLAGAVITHDTSGRIGLGQSLLS